MTILYTVLSRSPSAAPLNSLPAAHSDSPCPRPACPKIRRKERKTVGKERERKERKTVGKERGRKERKTVGKERGRKERKTERKRN